MTLDIEYVLEPIDILGRYAALEMHDEPCNYVVKIDGKICPPKLRDIILDGLGVEMLRYIQRVERVYRLR